MVRMFILIAVFVSGVEKGEVTVETEIIGRYTEFEACRNELIDKIEQADPNYWFSCKSLNATMV